MYLRLYARPLGWLLLVFISWWMFGGCGESPSNQYPTFREWVNAVHDSTYLDKYPVHNPDSCIIRLKAEVPEKWQPYACQSVWYRLPRTSPPLAFHFLDLYEKNYPHDTVRGFAQIMRAEYYVDLNKMDSARTCLDEASQIYTRLGKVLDLSDTKLLSGRILLYQNDNAAALQSYFEALDLINQHDTTFSERHLIIYHDIATAYANNHDLPYERQWLMKAWNANYARFEGPWLYKARITAALCKSYLGSSNPDSSIVWAMIAKDIFENKIKRPIPPRLLLTLGRSYLENGQCAAALPYCQEAYRKNPEQHELYGYFQYTNALGKCYLCLGQLDSAEFYLKQAMATPDTSSLAGTYEKLSEVYAGRGDYKGALNAHKELVRLFKINFTAEQTKAMADMEARYQSAQKERRISELESANQITRQQNLIIALFLLLALGAAIGLFFRHRNHRRLLQQQNQLLAQEKELVEAREILRIQELEHSQVMLKYTQEELSTTTHLLTLKNNLIEELELRLHRDHLAPSESLPPGSAENQELPRMKILTEKDWVQFRERFEQQLPGFFQNLKVNHPSLTTAEIRLFLLMKLNFDTLEISEALGISKESVWRSRHRLSKKLGLSETGDLDQFVQGFI